MPRDAWSRAKQLDRRTRTRHQPAKTQKDQRRPKTSQSARTHPAGASASTKSLLTRGPVAEVRDVVHPRDRDHLAGASAAETSTCLSFGYNSMLARQRPTPARKQCVEAPLRLGTHRSTNSVARTSSGRVCRANEKFSGGRQPMPATGGENNKEAAFSGHLFEARGQKAISCRPSAAILGYPSVHQSHLMSGSESPAPSMRSRRANGLGTMNARSSRSHDDPLSASQARLATPLRKRFTRLITESLLQVGDSIRSG